MNSVVVEVSGADSIAAALAYCAENPVDIVLPTFGTTGTEFGDFSEIEGNVAFLAAELELRHGVSTEPLEMLGDPALWRALNGRYGSVIAETYGACTPCPGCHLYLHMLRIPFALERGATVIVAGERELHDTRIKPNQLAPALDAYSAVVESRGLELALPLRHVTESAGISEILGERWSGGSPQLECVLSGNYRGLDGACALEAMPDAFYRDFLIPAATRIAEMMPGTSAEYDHIVAETLREARR
jgi:hypothetical protein